MLRRKNILTCFAVVAVSLTGVAPGEAVRQVLAPSAPESDACGQAVLNYVQGVGKTQIQVNCRGLEPETTYTILIYDDNQEASTYDLVGGFTTDKNGIANWYGVVEGDVSGSFAAILGDQNASVQLLYDGMQPWPPGLKPVPIDPPRPCVPVGTDNIIVNLHHPGRWLCSSEIQCIWTYADVDNDPSTGIWVGDTWYPNETQIVLWPDQGDLSVNWYETEGQILFSCFGANCGQNDTTQRGRFAIRFVDATAAGWVYDEPDTWQEKPINIVTLEMSHNEAYNEDPAGGPNPNPYLQVKAYRHWEQDGFVTEASQVGPSPWGEMVTVSLTGGLEGFAELYFSTDFAENTIDDLCLFVCAPLIRVETGDDPPAMSGLLEQDHSTQPAVGGPLQTHEIVSGISPAYPIEPREFNAPDVTGKVTAGIVSDCSQYMSFEFVCDANPAYELGLARIDLSGANVKVNDFFDMCVGNDPRITKRTIVDGEIIELEFRGFVSGADEVRVGLDMERRSAPGNNPTGSDYEGGEVVLHFKGAPVPGKNPVVASLVQTTYFEAEASF